MGSEFDERAELGGAVLLCFILQLFFAIFSFMHRKGDAQTKISSHICCSADEDSLCDCHNLTVVEGLERFG